MPSHHRIRRGAAARSGSDVLLWSVVTTGAAALSAHAGVVVTWTGPTTGNWNQTSGWSGLPGGFNWPGNAGGTLFDVFVDGNGSSGTSLFLNVSPTLTDLTVDAGDALTTGNGIQLRVGDGAAAGELHNDGVINFVSSGMGRPQQRGHAARGQPSAPATTPAFACPRRGVAEIAMALGCGGPP